MGHSSLKGATAGDRVRIEAPDMLKELSFLQEASYVYQENWIRRLHMGIGKRFLRGLRSREAEEGELKEQLLPHLKTWVSK